MTRQTGLSLADVSVMRGSRIIVHGVTVGMARGQIVGLIGPNGAGKSTLLAAIAGRLPVHGRITWDDTEITPALLGYMPQTGASRTTLTVLETVLLGRYDRLGWRIHSADMEAAEAALASLGLSDLAPRPLDTLSGGQQQLVLLAQRLVRSPQLMILDEATSALDLRHQMAVLGHLRSYVQRHNALVLIAIHDINLAARHCDALMVIAGGTLAALGPRQSVLTPQLLRHCFGVESDVMVTASGIPIVVPTAAA